MIATTGCDGVVVGRGCLGRPWLFRDLADAFAGRAGQRAAALGVVIDDDARRTPGCWSTLHGEPAARSATSASTSAGTSRLPGRRRSAGSG